MANVLVQESSLQAIAASIRQKNGSSTTYQPGQMAAAIQALPGASTLQSLSVTANGNYTPGTGVDGYSSVAVNVPNSYSQSDEGKVVSNGALMAQTARSGAITQNGTYDTTNNNEVTVNVSGGGGVATILSGVSEPTAAQGNDGDVYLKHTPVSSAPNLLESFQNIDLWTKNCETYSAAFQVHQVTFNDGVSTLVHKGGNGYERIFVPVSVTPNSDYIFVLCYRPGTNVPTGYSSSNLCIAVTYENQSGTGSSGSYNTLGNKVPLSRTQSDTFEPYSVAFNSGSYSTIYVMIDLNIADGSQVTLIFKNIELREGTTAYPGIVLDAKVKVDGAWQDLIGSDINDVGGITV